MRQLDTRLRWGLGMLVAVGLLGGPGAARGERPVDLLARTSEARVVAPSPTPRTFGTSNDNNTYFLEVTGAGTGFTAVRVNYTLQVSPAPAIGSFSDVPTGHPFFRFIEALVRSGITSGCGGGNFCPDAAPTGGQMAVFLSLGLGLHFAP